MDLAHPLGVASGQVVVDGDEVQALAAEPVEVGGQGRDERLALARLHLGDPPEVQGGAADELDVVVALAQHPLACFAHDCEGLDEQVVEVLAVVEPLTELAGLGPQGVVGQGLELGLENVDVGDQGLQGLELAALTRAEDLVEDAHAASEATGRSERYVLAGAERSRPRAAAAAGVSAARRSRHSGRRRQAPDRASAQRAPGACIDSVGEGDRFVDGDGACRAAPHGDGQRASAVGGCHQAGQTTSDDRRAGPCTSDSQPTSGPPIGVLPRKTMAWIASTRPRYSGAARTCTVAVDDVMKAMEVSPTSGATTKAAASDGAIGEAEHRHAEARSSDDELAGGDLPAPRGGEGTEHRAEAERREQQREGAVVALRADP